MLFSSLPTVVFTDCPGQEAALLTHDDFIVLNDETVQVKHRVHLQDRRKAFSVHTQLAAARSPGLPFLSGAPLPLQSAQG